MTIGDTKVFVTQSKGLEDNCWNTRQLVVEVSFGSKHSAGGS
jgi:hypothetical protein